MKRLLSFELGLNAIPKHSRNVCLQGQTVKTFPQHLPRLFEQAPHVRAKSKLDFWLLRFFAFVCFLSC